MKINEFVSQFRIPESPAKKEACVPPVEDIFLFAHVLAASKSSCVIEINGVEYEVARENIIEITPLETPDEKQSSGGAKSKAKAEPKEDATSTQNLAQLQLKRDTMLCKRIEVPAAAVAAVGTWSWVVMPGLGADPEGGCTPTGQ